MMGAHLVVHALQQQHTVRAIVRQAPNADSFFYKLISHHHCDIQKLELICCNYEDRQALSDAITGCDEVIHCAAKVNFDGKIKDMIAANVSLSKRIVNICIEHNIAHVSYLSSIAAIGQSYKGKYTWGDKHWNGLYGYTKFLGELEFLRAYEEGLDCSIYRPGVIVGPSDDNHPFSKMLMKSIFGKAPYTSGSSGFISADLLAKRVLAQHNKSPFAPSVMVTKNMTYKSMAEAIAEARQIETIHIPKTMLRLVQLLTWIGKFIGISKQRLRSHTVNSLTSGSNYSSIEASDDIVESLKESINFVGNGNL